MKPTERENLNRLIFATSNMRYLRGLAVLPTGLLMIAFPFLGHLSTRQPAIAGIALTVSIVIAVDATRRINKFYDRQYGKVDTTGPYGFPTIGIAVWGAIFGILLVNGRQAELSLTAVWLAAFFWGIYMSSSGYRWHYLVITACFALLAPHWNAIGELWQSVMLGAAFAVSGLMDHLLLARLLPAPKEDNPFNVA